MKVLIFAALAAACWAAGWLIGTAVHMWRSRRRTRRDDLMALADSLRLCGAVGVARDNGPHRMHDCTLGNLHAALDPMHYCGSCGCYWRTPAADAHQIAQLDRMLDADAYEPDRRT